MEAPAISTLQDDEDSPSPGPTTYETPVPEEKISMKVKLRIPGRAGGVTRKRDDEIESEEEDIDELQDDDEPQAPPPIVYLPQPSSTKLPSTRGGKGSRGPRKKRTAVVGEKLMSPPPKVLGTEWVVHTAPGGQAPSDDGWDPPSSRGGRGRGRGAAKRSIAGPGRGWRRGLTKGQKAVWPEGHIQGSDSTPGSFPSSLPPPPTVFREYHHPGAEVPPPSLSVHPAPFGHPIKLHVPHGAPPQIHAMQHPQIQYPPPIAQPSLPPRVPQMQHYISVQPHSEIGSMSSVHETGGPLKQPSHGIPSKPFPVHPAPKPSAAHPQATPQPLDKSGLKVRKWTHARREIKGIGGSRWLVRTWIGEQESEFSRALHAAGPPMMIFPPRYRFKPGREFGSTGTGTPEVLGTPGGDIVLLPNHGPEIIEIDMDEDDTQNVGPPIGGTVMGQ